MKFSILIPAHNEELCIGATLEKLVNTLNNTNFDFEIIVINDHCNDKTAEVVSQQASKSPQIRLIENLNKAGFGMALRAGLETFTGDAVAIFMADASDDPNDLCKYFEKIENGAECVFGSRFISGSKIIDYPMHKLILNRLGNYIIRILFRHGLNDTTNAFKCYRREVIEGLHPFLSVHFNLTVELPLKAVIRGYEYEVIPISWQNRSHGISKLRIREMGSKYFFIIFYCLLEKWLVGKDYHRKYD